MSTLPGQVEAALAAAVGARIVAARPVHGGDVAAAYRIELDDERVIFAKTRLDATPEVFATEAAGLAWLADAVAGLEPEPSGPPALAVPEVLAVGADVPVLALEWIEEGRGRPTTDSEAAFGRALAGIHQTGAPSFGRQDRRPTGSRNLPNEQYETWAEAYAANRLLPLARLAADTGALSRTTVAGLEAIAADLGRFGAADEPPARLHGDLWAGNRLIDGRGRSWLIDPAAHGGHREFDLAMMRLFGGWADAAFHAYHEVHPLASGWPERIRLHQLAPLAVHAIKFGGGYVAATADAVAAYL